MSEGNIVFAHLAQNGLILQIVECLVAQYPLHEAQLTKAQMTHARAQHAPDIMLPIIWNLLFQNSLDRDTPNS